MEFEEPVKESLLNVLRQFCVEKIVFTGSVQISTIVHFLVDDGIEYQYMVKDSVTEETLKNSLQPSNHAEVQTDPLPALNRDSQFAGVTENSAQTDVGWSHDETKEPSGTVEQDGINKLEGQGEAEGDVAKNDQTLPMSAAKKSENKFLPKVPVAVKKEKMFDSDDDTTYDNEEIEKITSVMPSSPSDEERPTRQTRKTVITCPLCPSTFQNTNSAEKHLRDHHDIGNFYICSLCQEVCPSNEAFLKHMQHKHKISASEAIADEEPVSTRRSRRGRKPMPKRVLRSHLLVTKNEGEDADVKPQTIKLKIKKSSLGVEKKKVRKRKPNSADMKRIIAKKGPVVETDPALKELKPKRKAAPKTKLGITQCEECGKEYQSKRALRRHFASVHELKRYQCDACGKCFTGKESLYHHKRGIHENSKPYKCEVCGESFNFNHSLKLHLLKHSGKRPYECTQCGKTYLTNNHLKVHIQAVHAEKKIYPCSVCGKRFSYTTSLRMHEMAHDNVRPYKCEICNKGFVNGQALKYHRDSKHTFGKTYTCDICGKGYKTEFLMKTHQRRHTADGSRYMCDICGRQFMYKSTLDVHASVHSEVKAYTCSTCGKSFKTYATLYSHQYVHKSATPHNCPVCGKGFKTKERLKAHEYRHSGLKPFECNLCGHCFPDKGGLSKHMKSVHCPVKKFVCDYCGKSCSRADNLRVHMRIHGKGEVKRYALGKNLSLEEVPPSREQLEKNPSSADHEYIGNTHSEPIPAVQESISAVSAAIATSLTSDGSTMEQPLSLTLQNMRFADRLVDKTYLNTDLRIDEDVVQQERTGQGGHAVLDGEARHTLQPLSVPRANMLAMAHLPETAGAHPPVTTRESSPASSAASAIPSVNPAFMYAWPYVYSGATAPNPEAGPYYH